MSGSIGVRWAITRRSAFTLLEMLAVIGIIGILLLILLPAVQRVRESARQTQCQSNLKQLALALNSYQTLQGRFPPSIEFDQGDKPGRRHDWPDQPNTFRPNWVIRILSFIEQQNIYKQFDLTKPIQHPANEAARGTDIPIMLCPTDLGSEVKYSDAVYQSNWARGNYGANGCLGLPYHFYGAPLDGPILDYVMACGSESMPYWKNTQTRGVMGSNVSLRSAQITDGMTKTILLTEVRIGLAANDRRGTWAMGLPGASSVWGVGYGTSPSPNHAGGDNISGCEAIISLVGAEKLQREGMGCGPLVDPSTNKASPRSRHAGGVYVAMCDGSVHWISDSIATAGITSNSTGTVDVSGMQVWQRLNAASDGLPVDMGALD